MTMPEANEETGLDAGPRAGAAGTERFCVATGTVKPIAELIRFVLDPDGAVTPDLKQKLPGRGLWVTANHLALDAAIKRKAFARGFKRDVKVRPDLADFTDALLEQAALDALAMVHKAGCAVAGFSKVEAALAREQVVAVLHAAEASADGVRKIDGAMWRRVEMDGKPIIQMRTFTASQMDLAFGRPNVVHAALLASPASETFLARASRLDRFRAGGPDKRGVRNGS
jgi:predicted RNA-binding protein YlxR (DUF448 family)